MSNLNTVRKLINDIVGLCTIKGKTPIDFLESLNSLMYFAPNRPNSDSVKYFIGKTTFYNEWIELFDGTTRDLGQSFTAISDKVDSALASIRRIPQFSKYDSKYPFVKQFGKDINLAYLGQYLKPSQNQWNMLIVNNFSSYFSNEFVKNQKSMKGYIGYYLQLNESLEQMDLTKLESIFDECIDLLSAIAIYYQIYRFSDELFNGKYSQVKRVAFEIGYNNKIFRSTWMDIDFNEFSIWFSKFFEKENIEKYLLDDSIDNLEYIRPITPMVDKNMFTLRLDQNLQTENRVSNHIDYRK